MILSQTEGNDLAWDEVDGYLALVNSLASSSGPMQWDSAVSQCLSQCIKTLCTSSQKDHANHADLG